MSGYRGLSMLAGALALAAAGVIPALAGSPAATNTQGAQPAEPSGKGDALCAKPPCPEGQPQAKTTGAPLKGVDVKLGKNPK